MKSKGFFLAHLVDVRKIVFRAGPRIPLDQDDF